MNERQREVIDRVDADVARSMRPHNMRMALYHRVNLLPDDQLARLLKIVQALTPDELEMALGYAEGLAAWSTSAQESQDAPLAKRSAASCP